MEGGKLHIQFNVDTHRGDEYHTDESVKLMFKFDMVRKAIKKQLIENSKVVESSK